MVIKSFVSRDKHDPHKPLFNSFRVHLTDIDPNLHLTNSRYPTFVDLMRLKFMIQTGLLKKIRKMGGYPVVGSVYTRFRRDLKPFSKFTVKIELVYVSPRWFYLDYKFLKDGFVHAHVLEKWGGRRPDTGMIPPFELLESGPGIVDFPRPPAHIIKMMATEDEMRIVVRKDS